MKRKIFLGSLILNLFLINFALAQDFRDFVQNLTSHFSKSLSVIFIGTIALIFLYTGFKLATSASQGKGEELNKTKIKLLWVFLALVLAMSFWAIVNFWLNTLGWNKDQSFEFGGMKVDGKGLIDDYNQKNHYKYWRDNLK